MSYITEQDVERVRKFGVDPELTQRVNSAVSFSAKQIRKYGGLDYIQEVSDEAIAKVYFDSVQLNDSMESKVKWLKEVREAAVFGGAHENMFYAYFTDYSAISLNMEEGTVVCRQYVKEAWDIHREGFKTLGLLERLNAAFREYQMKDLFSQLGIDITGARVESVNASNLGELLGISIPYDSSNDKEDGKTH